MDLMPAKKKFFKTVGVYTGRGIFSLRFLGCTLVLALLMFSFVESDYFRHFDVTLYYFYMNVGEGYSTDLLNMIAALPAITLFCEDYSSGKFLLTYARTGKKIYPFAVTLSSGITTAILVTVSYLIFSAVILLGGYPAVPDLEPAVLRWETIGLANSALLPTVPVLFYALWIVREAMCTAVYSMLGILLSVFITNIHLTIVSPLMMSMLYDIFNRVIRLPFWMDFGSVYSGSLSLFFGFGGTLDDEIFSPISAVYPFIYTIISVIIISIITGKMISLKLNSKLGVSR